MIGEIVLTIETDANAVDLGKTIHRHPMLGVNIGLRSGLCLRPHSGWPTVSAISATPWTRPVIRSPGTTAPTPSGVPV